MFSGIVTGVGRILALSESGGDLHLAIDYAGVALEPPRIGASIAVNGVCLTATASSADRFEADVSSETLSVTNFSSYSVGTRVNLEAPLRLGDPLDGHLVTGHVDGVGRVSDIQASARSRVVQVELPEALVRYVARKGSVTVDGVSLTVNAVGERHFEVNVVPHTLDMTIIPDYRPGTAVNIEVDILARYVERLAVAPPG